MAEFYKDIRSGAGKAQALRTAMLATMKQFPDPRAWAAFTILGVPDASPLLRSVHGAAAGHLAQDYSGIFTLPNGAHDYSQSNAKTYEFFTSMSMTDLIAFYRNLFRAKGYREDPAHSSANKQTFTVAFIGPWTGQMLLAQGMDMGDGSRVMTVGLYPNR